MNDPIPEEALRAVGELLEFEGHSIAIVVLGGSAMILLGLVSRATKDVDVVALATESSEKMILQRPDPLPDPLRRAIERVAFDLGLEPDWMNAAAGGQWDTGLPPGMEGRLHWRDYAGLRVGLVDRQDLVFFKLYAAADHTGPSSVHYQDLVALRPSPSELEKAAEWITTQDASKDFARIVDQVVRSAERDVARGS
jgi:hypothetical protein